MGHGLGMGSNGFGAKSSRHQAAASTQPRSPAGPGELSEAKLNAHNVAQASLCGLIILEESGCNADR